jgi:multidrug efflux pump subunit AcrB
MNISAPFIRRPIGTILLTAAIALAGMVAYLQLPRLWNVSSAILPGSRK